MLDVVLVARLAALPEPPVQVLVSFVCPPVKMLSAALDGPVMNVEQGGSAATLVSQSSGGAACATAFVELE